MDMVKSSFDFLIAMICALLLTGCGGNGEDLSSNASLASLTLSSGQLDQVFQSGQLDYTATVSFVMASTTVTPTVADPNAMVTANGTAVRSGNPSEAIFLGQGETVITVVVTAEDAVTSRHYSITVTRELATSFAQQAYVKASNTGLDDHFGGNEVIPAYGVGVALSGDTLAVGAPGEDSAATGIDGDQTDNSAIVSGAVYVYTREGAVWTQQAYIKASNTDKFDSFGQSVALSGDTLAVAAPGEDSAATGIDGDQADNSAYSSGAVYMFTREGTVWGQQTYIKGSNTGGSFGESVALSGDTLAVGDPSDGSGAVYLFTRDGTVWMQQAYIKPSNSDSGDGFGTSVAISGDTLAVGARWEASAATGIDGDQADNSASGSGAVYVFTREDTMWSQQAYIKASNTGPDDHFGGSVALSGDTLAVGAYGEDSAAVGIDGDQVDNSASASGAVYVYTREGTVWRQQSYIKASNTSAFDEFGGSVALSGDTLFVGATGEDSFFDGSGAVYMFTRKALAGKGAAWTQQHYMKASNPGLQDHFGGSVALSGDTLAVAAPLEDSLATGIDGDQSDDYGYYDYVDQTYHGADSGAVYVHQ